MNCPSCNAPVRPGARFCGSCGTTLSQLVEVNCPNCQAPIDPAHRFCARCGYELQGGARPVPSVPAKLPEPTKPIKAGPQPARPRAWLWTALVVLLLALSATAAWVLLRTGPFPPTVAPAVDAPSTEAPSMIAEMDDAQRTWDDAQAAVASGDTHTAVMLLQSLRSQWPEFQADRTLAQLGALCRAWAQQAAAQADKSVLDALACLASVSPSDPGLAQQSWWQAYFDAEALLLSGQAAAAVALLEPLQQNEFAGGRQRDMLYDAYLHLGGVACSKQERETGRDWYLRARALDPIRTEAGSRLADCLPPSATPTHTPIPSATPTSLPPGAMQAVYDQEGRLNVRMGPGFNYPIVAALQAGAQFTITSRTHDATWLEAVDNRGETVWIYAELLNLNYPPAAAPLTLATPLPPAEYLVADSEGDFSPKQGDKYWFYTASKSPGSLDFDQMPVDGRWYRWTGGGRSPEMRLSAKGSYPSWNSDAMRLWVSLYQGVVRIDGRAYKEQGAGYGGNGVDLRIVQRRPESDQDEGFDREIWHSSLGPRDIDGFTFSVDPFDVMPRDQIFFITSAKGDDQRDNTIFTAQVILMNEGGVEVPATPTPSPTPPPTAVPPLCFEPRLRHFEEHKGCCGEVVGIAYTNNGRLSFGNIHIEGPPATQQYKRDFVINQDGGYEITALTAFPTDSIFYTVWLTGPRIRSQRYEVHFQDAANIRAVVDWYQVPCN